MQQLMLDDNPSAALGDDEIATTPAAGFPSTRITSGQSLQLDLPECIPEHFEVHQVSSSSSLQPTRLRKTSPIYQPQDYYTSRQLTDRQYKSSRRYSEPAKPNLRQMAVLNSIHMKLVSGSDQDQNNNKVGNTTLLYS